MTSAEIAVVGGGPAGLMAAWVLVEAGQRVTVFDARRSPGRKFVLAGRSGLNLTHGEPHADFVRRYGPDQDFLRGPLGDFGPSEVRQWADALGAKTFVGSSGRVFPEAMSATPLLRAWLRELDARGVTLRTDHRWVGWTGDGSTLRFATGAGEVTHSSDATVLALGGASWPRVSSDGSWKELLSDRGIETAPFQSSNCGARVGWTDVLRERFVGTPLKNVAVTVDRHGVRGDLMITETGLEGGPVYAQSRSLRTMLAAAPSATVQIDLLPDLSAEALAARLAKRRPNSTVTSWLRSVGLSPVAIAVLRDALENQLPNDDDAMARAVKSVTVRVDGLAPIDKAISSVGGVALSAVDQHLMLIDLPGVFVAGEMLDWDAPTGGYLLQACFSTGVAAASGVLARIRATA